MKVYNIFPLTIYQSKIEIEDNEKKNLTLIVKSMKSNSKNLEYYNKVGSWTGDTQGFENLHMNPDFNNLYREIKLFFSWGSISILDWQIVKGKILYTFIFTIHKVLIFVLSLELFLLQNKIYLWFDMIQL